MAIKIYGLIIQKTSQQKKSLAQAKPSVFGDDSDSDDAPAAKVKVGKPQTKLKKTTQIAIDQALAEDPTVYQYDDVYEDIQAKKASHLNKDKSKADKKPKYIEGLIKAAENRKRENERRTERVVQKEREEEKGKYDDSEVFVTGAYRKKMLEMQKLEDEEKRKDQMEEMLDVTKQKDLSGFYRHLLNRTVDVKKEEETKPDIKPASNQEIPVSEIKTEDLSQDKDFSMSSETSSDSSDTDSNDDYRLPTQSINVLKTSNREKRNYRHHSESPEDNRKAPQTSSRHVSDRRRSRSRDQEWKDRRRRSRSREREHSSRERSHYSRHDDRRNERNRDSGIHRSQQRYESRRSDDRRRDDRQRDEDRGRSDRHKTDERRISSSSRHEIKRGADKRSDDREKSDRQKNVDDDRHAKRQRRESDKEEDLDRDDSSGDSSDSDSDKPLPQPAKHTDHRDNNVNISPDTTDKLSSTDDIKTKPVIYSKHTTGDNLNDARAKYLARKKIRTIALAPSDD